ncbi:MAG TPA: molybdopterin-synthase adenylyltransferase MoeB [Burkholderiaceae bacterium]|nr:molybdopterin-synthase adenylyltransferase MoeB [Burkholderiaceae bacterium]
MTDDELLRYSRHILLEEIGIEGQARIRASRMLVVGAGGLGSPVAMYLASAGVGRLTLADPDEVDLTNLQRQILHTTQRIGQAKALSGAVALQALNPQVDVVPLVERLDSTRLAELVETHDIVLDCCDNFATRHAVNWACVAARKPLVSGAAIRFDGQVSVFDVRTAERPCYHCLFPEGEDVEEVRCAVMGVFAPMTGIIGTIQAAEALKLAAGVGSALAGRLLLVDGRSMRFTEIAVPRDPGCAVCAPLR